MKLYKFFLSISFFLFTLANAGFSQANVDIGIFENPAGSGTLEIRVRPTANFNGLWSSTVFTIRWLDSYGVSLLNPTSGFGVAKDGGEITSAGFRYQVFTHNAFHSVNWTSGQEIVAMTITHDGNGTGTGTFELVNDGWTSANNGDHYEELGGADKTGIIYNASASVALPVELLRFDAFPVEDDVMVEWSTATEIGSDRFEVERSANGKDFKLIETVKAAGWSYEMIEYSIIDHEPLSGANYYRLKQVDLSGDFKYSHIVTVRMENDWQIKAFPNPNNGIFTLNIQNPTDLPVQAKLVDLFGRTVWESTFNDASGEVMEASVESDLAAGIYTLIVSQGNKIGQVLMEILGR